MFGLEAATIVTNKLTLPNYGSCPLNKATSTQRYKVFGNGLTANIMITATANFEISFNINKGFCQSLQLVPISGKVDSTEIYVRFTPVVVGTLSGQINQTSTGASVKTIAVSGTGIASANIPLNYYSAQTGTGSALLSSLSSKISGHTVSSYAGLWATYANTDPNYDGKLWDIYSTAVTGNAASYVYTFSVNQCGSYAIEGDCYNREHSFPQSWFADASPMVSDMHHIFPTDGKVNGMRSNYPYGEVNTPTYTSQIGGKLGPSVSAGYTGIVFEPVDEYKGDVARAQLYMATRYNNAIATWVSNSNANEILSGNAYPVFDAWFLNLLIKWHNQDPPSVKEINRNNAIFGYQGNRNPYIDSPQFVNKIWGLALPLQPTIAAESLQVDSFANNKLKISWKTGNGSNRIVLMRAAQAINNFPIDSMAYIANSTFGSGSKIGNDIYVVYNGSGSTTWVNGLQNNTNYYLAVIEYNGLNHTANYLQSSPLLAGPYSQGGCSGSVITLNTDSIQSCTSYVKLDAGTGFTAVNWIAPSNNPSAMLTYNPIDNSVSPSAVYANATGWFKVNVTNSLGCMGSDSMYVKLNTDKRNVLLSDSMLACTDSVLLSATSGFTNFSWNTGQTSSSIYAKTNAWYQIQATNSYGCVVKDSSYVKLNTDKRNVLLSDSISACTDSLLLSATTGFSNFIWNTGQTSSSIYAKTNAWYQIQATNSYGCVVKDSSYVKLNTDKRNVLLSDSISACTDSLLLSATTGFSNFIWNTGQTSSSIYAKTNAWYQIQATNSYGCVVKDSSYVLLHHLQVASISALGATQNCSGNAIQLFAPTQNNVNYQWYQNGLAINGASAAIFSALNSGEYQLMLTSTVLCGTSSSNKIIVSIQRPVLTILPENQQLIFGRGTGHSFSDPSNWYVYQSSTNSFEPSMTAPTLGSKVMIPAKATCVLSEPILTTNASINSMVLEAGAVLDLNGNELKLESISGTGKIKAANGNLHFTGTTNAGTLYLDSIDCKLNKLSYNQSLNLGSKLELTGNLVPISGTLFTQGNLVLKSTAQQTAQINTGSGNYLNGEVVVERYIPGTSGRRYRYLAAPFAQGPNVASSWQQQIHITGLGIGGSICPNLTPNSNGFDATSTSTYSMLNYNEQTAISFGTGVYGTTVYANAWKGIHSTITHQLTAGTGYNVFVRGNRTQGCSLLNGTTIYNAQDVLLSAKGTIQTGPFQFNVTYSPSNGKGWNLIGNPYPSSIVWSDNTQAWQRNNIENAYWIYKPSGDHYASWNGALQMGTNQASHTIESGSSFFVKANSNNPSLALTEMAKQTQLQASTMFKNEISAIRILFVKPDKVQDEAIVAISGTAQNSKDEMDTEKMGNNNLNVYTKTTEGINCAIQTIAQVDNFIIIPLAVQSNFTGMHHLSFKGLIQIDGYDVLLEDTYTGVVLNIQTQNQYSFNVSSAPYLGEQRFRLMFVNKGSNANYKHLFTGQNSSINTLQIYPNPIHSNAILKCQGLEGISAKLLLINQLGQISRIEEQLEIVNGNLQLDLSVYSLKNGIYLLEITDDLGNCYQSKMSIQ